MGRRSYEPDRYPPFCIKKIGGIYRIMYTRGGGKWKPATTPNGQPRDGGGHHSFKAARYQCNILNNHRGE